MGLQAGLGSSCPPSRDSVSRGNCGWSPGEDDDWHSVGHMFIFEPITKVLCPKLWPAFPHVGLGGSFLKTRDIEQTKVTRNKRRAARVPQCLRGDSPDLDAAACACLQGLWGVGALQLGAGLCASALWVWGSFPGQSCPRCRGSLHSPHSLQGWGVAWLLKALIFWVLLELTFSDFVVSYPFTL